MIVPFRSVRYFAAAASAAALMICIALSPAAAGEAPESVVSLLKTHASEKLCGRQSTALRGTLERLASMSIPVEGRLILVNIASRTLAAYENGVPIMESRVVIGREGWHTPDLATTVDYVRVNPTWTVPESIVRSYGWREKLAENPGWFARNGFDVIVGNEAIDPRDIDDNEIDKATFVQKPGRGNALGKVKIGLIDSNGIYLHDTNDPAAYDRRGVESHGCIRVEEASELAAWVLGIDKDELTKLASDGDRTNRKPTIPVRVVVGYFTAWPDSEDKIHYYKDIYDRDPHGSACRKPGSDETESPYGASATINPMEDGKWPSD